MKVKITNFRGIKSLEMTITNNTEIIGPNGSGKSTILDALIWCLTGRDTKGRSNYKIITVGTELDARVKVEVDGVEYSRTLCPLPAVSRGQETGKMMETTIYCINNAVVTKKEFDEFVDENQPFWAFVDASFWSRMHWKDRLKALLKKYKLQYTDDATAIKESNKLKKELESLTDQIMVLNDMPVCPNCADTVAENMANLERKRDEKADRFARLQANLAEINEENRKSIAQIPVEEVEFIFELDGKLTCEAVINCPEGKILFPHANTAEQMKTSVEISRMFVDTVVLDNAESVLSGLKCCTIKCGENNE